MSKNTTDELRELFVKHGYPKMTQAELELIPAILDWHNKQVEEVLDRLEGGLVAERMKQNAERNKLKEAEL